ncbi:MAG: hypothetical protein ACJ8GK_12100 [Luteimonas sp.]
MTDIMLRDIDAVLAERIGRIAQAHGWTLPQALLRLLELGLHACEGETAMRLAGHESDVLQAAIAALESVPSDPGFALIGRAPATPVPAQEPDQAVAAHFDLEPPGQLD